MEPANCFDASRCPIPNSHQRLRQAHLLWHQTAESYHEPERFLTNLNSLIQELRNVTFILQSEKSRFSSFETWYLPWQAKLKANKNCEWLKDARNLVVKQGALQGSSFVTLKFLTYDEIETARFAILEGLSSKEILQSEEVQQKITEMRASVASDEDPVLLVEKSWSTAELDGTEILEVLAELYGLLAEIVANAHLNIGSLGCIPILEVAHHAHRDFPLLYDRSRKLRCMMNQAQDRSEFFRLSNLEPLTPTMSRTALDLQSWKAQKRYGLDDGDLGPAFERLDPSAFADRVVYTSKKILRKDRQHARFIWLRDTRGNWRQMLVVAENRAEKHLLMHQLGRLVSETGCDAFLEVGEIWTAPVDSAFRNHSLNLEAHPNRREGLVVQVATRDGLARSYLTHFSRGKNGGIKFGNTSRMELIQTNHLAPVLRAWRKQRRPTPGSAESVVLWKPDDLELCPCGGELAFGVCCKPTLQDLGGEYEPDIHTMLRNGEHEKAVKTARARVARYAIWIRQHTALSINMDPDFATLIVPTDALALEAEIAVLEQTLSVVGKSEAMLFTYHRLREILGVPALVRRVVSLSARSLIQAGKIEEGLLELDALGEIGRCGDSLALSLAAQYGGYSESEETVLLEKAVAVALGSEERSFVLSGLAYRHFFAERWPQSMEIISSVLADPKADKNAVRSLKVLQWRITGRADEFLGALEGMHEAHDPEEKLCFASWLMDTDHVSEALGLLKSMLESKNIRASLLGTDCHLRLANVKAATELFDSIDPLEIAGPITNTYAYVQGLLGLSVSRRTAKAICDLDSLIESENGSVPKRDLEALLVALRARVVEQAPQSAE